MKVKKEDLKEIEMTNQVVLGLRILTEKLERVEDIKDKTILIINNKIYVKV